MDLFGDWVILVPDFYQSEYADEVKVVLINQSGMVAVKYILMPHPIISAYLFESSSKDLVRSHT